MSWHAVHISESLHGTLNNQMAVALSCMQAGHEILRVFCLRSLSTCMKKRSAIPDGGGEALPKAPRIILRYMACAGLFNQHYSHIAALTLAAALDATLVMAPAVQRNSYAKLFSMSKEHNEVEWTPAPLDSLLDVSKIMETWSAKGITIQMVRLVPLILAVLEGGVHRELQRRS